jgi:hypothetical protein
MRELRYVYDGWMGGPGPGSYVLWRRDSLRGAREQGEIAARCEVLVADEYDGREGDGWVDGV